MKIGLALSGGGIRAAVFHLGMLLRLADEDLLESVTQLSTVSGGSMYVTPDGLMMMSEYNVEHEEEATWFAGAILVPRDALLGMSRRGVPNQDAAKHFGVSVELLVMRRNRTGVDIQLTRQRRTWAP